MKRAIMGGLVVLAFLVGLLVAQQQGASARQTATPQVTPAVAVDQGPVTVPEPEPCAKKCNFNADCPHGKCKNGFCGACDFNSDCKGWGKCKAGSCGKCDFNSDCTSFGPCNGGTCAKSPY